MDLKINTIGTEISGYAIEKANASGLPVYLLDIEQAANKLDAQPDATLAFQVLEHIANPLSFINQMVNNLSVGGN